MSIVPVREGGVIKRQPTIIGDIVLDISVSEEHDYTSTIPAFPVEAGAEISDNVTLMPKKLVITGYVSSVSIFGDVEDPDSTYKKILDLRDSKKPFSVTTPLKVYENMMFSRITVPRDSSNFAAFEFTAEMQEVNIATVAFIQIQKAKPRFRKVLKPVTNKGKLQKRPFDIKSTPGYQYNQYMKRRGNAERARLAGSKKAADRARLNRFRQSNRSKNYGRELIKDTETGAVSFAPSELPTNVTPDMLTDKLPFVPSFLR